MLTSTENNKIKNKNIEQSYKNVLSILNNFLKERTVYEAIPENMKILVFNSELSIKESIKAMVDQDIYCALIYNSILNYYIGIITIRDILNLLKYINDKYKNIKGPIINMKYVIQEIFKEYSEPTLDTIKETSECSSIYSNSIIIDNNSNNYEQLSNKSNRSTNSIIDEIKESLSNNTLNQVFQDRNVHFKDNSDFFNSLQLITINDYFIFVKGLDINSKISLNLVKLKSIDLDSSLISCVKIINENSIHRIITEENKTYNTENNNNNYKIKNYTGFITYETIFEFFIENFYSFNNMEEFKINLKDILFIKNNFVSKISKKFDKRDYIYNVFEYFNRTKYSIAPIYDNEKLYGFVYLKDLIFFFKNGGKLFSFNETIEKFLTKLYEGIDIEKPFGKERIHLLYLKNEDYILKNILEMMSTSPERKIIIVYNNELYLITLSNIFKSVLNNNENK